MNLKRLYFILTLLFVYIILFEFILPVNKILPKPSILLETIPVLFKDYGVLKAVAVTTSAVYICMIIGYLLVEWFAGAIFRFYKTVPQVLSVMKVFIYIPLFVYAVLFAFWFPESILAEFLFLFILTMSFMKIKVMLLGKKVSEEYVLSSASLGLSEKEYGKKVVWKFVQPGFFRSLKNLHLNLWLFALVYEYIGGSFGLGSVFNTALHFNDFSGVVILSLMAAILIWVGELIIRFFEKRIIHWES